MKAALYVAFLIVFITGTEGRAQEVRDSAAEAKIEHAMRRAIIPRLEFREATLREAVDFLKKKSLEFSEENSTTVPSAFARLQVPATQPENPAHSTPAAAEKRITLSLRDVSIYDALQKITAAAGVKFWIRADGVHTGLTEPEPVAVKPRK
ncbi:MAG TPA: hypothetical protein VK961_17765 [Chthoniobacter sp.]|nr:hypothetical protein [Chthoniobacter sp.]